MSHNLAVKNEVTMAAFAIDKNGLPWHNLGQMVQGAMTWQEAMTLAHMDFNVSKRPLFMKNPSYDGNGGIKGWAVPNHFAICRDDVEGEKGILGFCSNTYVPLQNVYMFSWVDAVLEAEDGAHYESAGVLGKGERIWCLARVPGADYSIGKDEHQIYVLFESSHDCSLASTVRLTDVRVVCNNTLQSALGTGLANFIKIKHTKSAEGKLNEVKRLWTGVKQNVDTLKAKFNRLTEVKITPDSFSTVMGKLFGDDWAESTRKKNIARDVASIYLNNDDDKYPEQKGTAYALLNAVTNYVDHTRSTRITAGNEHYTESMARADSAMAGSGSTLKEKALEVIYELADISIPQVSFPKNETVDKILSMVN